VTTFCDVCNTRLFRGKVCKECEDSLLNLTLDEMDRNSTDSKRLTVIDGKLQKKPRVDEVDLDIWEMVEWADAE